MKSTLHLHIIDPKYTFQACYDRAWSDCMAVLSFSGSNRDQNDTALAYLSWLNDPNEDSESLVAEIAEWLKDI